MRQALPLFATVSLFTLALGCGGGGELPVAPKPAPGKSASTGAPDEVIKGRNVSATGAPDSMSSSQKLLD